MAGRPIVIMGVFVADLAFRAPKLPAWGETVLGLSFKLGPGGKGSNQAIAAARLGGTVAFISKLGRDTFGDIARRTYAEEGVDTRFLFEFDRARDRGRRHNRRRRQRRQRHCRLSRRMRSSHSRRDR